MLRKKISLASKNLLSDYLSGSNSIMTENTFVTSAATPDGLTYKNCDGMLTLFHWGKVEKKIALDSMALVAKLRTDLGM